MGHHCDSASQWSIVESHGRAEPFHGKRPTDQTEPQVWIHRVVKPTIVLGSSQAEDVVNRQLAQEQDLEVCKRRSGGGLVYVDPDTDCWIDLIIPTSSRLFETDIARAFHWVGTHWSRTLASFYADDSANSFDPGDTRTCAPDSEPKITMATTSQQTPMSKLLCFAGLGHGELTIDGSKVVGLSQRRSRHWVRIQSLLLGRWNSQALEPLVNPRYLAEAGIVDLAAIPAGLPPDLPVPDPKALAKLFTANLPDP